MRRNNILISHCSAVARTRRRSKCCRSARSHTAALGRGQTRHQFAARVVKGNCETFKTCRKLIVTAVQTSQQHQSQPPRSAWYDSTASRCCIRQFEVYADVTRSRRATFSSWQPRVERTSHGSVLQQTRSDWIHRATRLQHWRAQQRWLDRASFIRADGASRPRQITHQTIERQSNGVFSMGPGMSY